MAAPLECSLCSKVFKKQHDLAVHMKGRAHQDAVAAADERAALNAEQQQREAMTVELRARVSAARETFLAAMYDALQTLPPAPQRRGANLGESILFHYEDSRPRPIICQRREALIGLVRSVVALVQPDAVLEVYGSIPLRLDAESSDIDMSVVSPLEPEPLLQSIASALAACGLPSLTLELIVTARIPLISMKESLSGLELDLSIWFVDKQEIARVFEAFLALDERVRPLLKAVRLWAGARHMRDAYNGTINSFGWSIMTLAFLQTRGILPCSSGLDVSQPDPRFVGFATTDTSDVGTLFRDLIAFLLDFDYRTMRLSIRHAGITAKEPERFDDTTVWCVERPRTAYQNVTRQVTDHTVRHVLHVEFRRALSIIDAGGAVLSDLL